MQFALQSQVRWHGYDPESAILKVPSPDVSGLVVMQFERLAAAGVYDVWFPGRIPMENGRHS